MVGHSFGANVAIEMAACGHFHGALIVLAPTLSAEDEMKGFETVNRIGCVPVLRSLVTALLFKSFPNMLKGQVPEDQVERLPAEMARNTSQTPHQPKAFLPALVQAGDARRPAMPSPAFTPRSSSARTTEVGVTPSERTTLEWCPTVRLRYVPDCGHLLPNQKPELVASLIVDTVTQSF